jgi:hypothetical protein
MLLNVVLQSSLLPNFSGKSVRKRMDWVLIGIGITIEIHVPALVKGETANNICTTSGYI